jgi:hypothetical protein
MFDLPLVIRSVVDRAIRLFTREDRLYRQEYRPYT